MSRTFRNSTLFDNEYCNGKVNDGRSQKTNKLKEYWSARPGNKDGANINKFNKTKTNRLERRKSKYQGDD